MPFVVCRVCRGVAETKKTSDEAELEKMSKSGACTPGEGSPFFDAGWCAEESEALEAPAFFSQHFFYLSTATPCYFISLVRQGGCFSTIVAVEAVVAVAIPAGVVALPSVRTVHVAQVSRLLVEIASAARKRHPL